MKNLEQLQKKLIAAARANPPGDSVPYSFEKRIMARIASAPKLDVSALWANALWRMAAPCVALAVILGTVAVVNVTSPIVTNSSGATVADGEDFSQHFESTLLATVNEPEDAW